MHILDYNVEPRSTAEANIQQAFLDILDKDVIKPLVSLKASRGLFVRANNLIIGPSGRKRKIRQGNGLRRISRDLLRTMPILQRTQSRCASKHTSRNITLGNMFTLPAFYKFLKTF